jgi:hypothetical protein
MFQCQVLNRVTGVRSMRGQALSCKGGTPDWSTFVVHASKLMKTCKRRSIGGYVCRTRHLTARALTLWSAAVIGALDMATTSKNRSHMCLCLNHVLLTVTCLHSKWKVGNVTLWLPFVFLKSCHSERNERLQVDIKEVINVKANKICSKYLMVTYRRSTLKHIKSKHTAARNVVSLPHILWIFVKCMEKYSVSKCRDSFLLFSVNLLQLIYDFSIAGSFTFSFYLNAYT